MDCYDRYLELKHVIKKYKIKNIYTQTKKAKNWKNDKVSIRDLSLLLRIKPIPIPRPERAYLKI